jgi:hypothetical protein
LAASALTREEFDLVFSALHSQWRPRIICVDGSTIDASKVCAISPIEEQRTGLFSFVIVGDSDVFRLPINSEDVCNLAEVRRRLVSFVWPDAHVFSADEVDHSPRLSPSELCRRFASHRKADD